MLLLQFYDAITGEFLGTYCGTNTAVITSKSNAIYILFSTDGSVIRRGFHLSWIEGGGKEYNESLEI